MIVGVGGSLASTSRSLAALRISAAAAEAEGAQVRVFEIERLDLPFYAPGREPSPQASAFAEAVYKADGRC
jgi:NAD(P)H-dependent FMN reductase